MALENNPLILKSNLKYGAIPFDEIKLKHFMPALEYSINEAEKNLEKIINNHKDVTFENTILKMENGTELMGNIAHVYFNLMGAESNNKFKELAQQISPLLSKFSNKVLLNSKLFKRIQFLYDHINEISLNDEQKRLVKENYNDFINNGALLNEEDKEKIQKIDAELSKLQPQFSQNTLNSTNSFSHTITNKEELSGLPSMVIEHAAAISKEKGNQNGWTFTLQMPCFRPIMQYAKDRSLREKMMREFGKISFGGKYDNQKIIKAKFWITIHYMPNNWLFSIFNKGFGIFSMYSESLVPKPPANIMNCIRNNYYNWILLILSLSVCNLINLFPK